MRSRFIWIVIGIAAFGVLLGVLLLTDSASPPQDRQSLQQGIAVDQPAPDFEIAGINGEAYRLSDFRGQVVFLNFWATWCIPCRAEMPAFQAFMQLRGGDAIILAVNADGESIEAMTLFLNEIGVSGLSIGFDPQREVATLYGVNPLPTTFVIDTNGVVRTVRFGEMTEADLREITDFLLRDS